MDQYSTLFPEQEPPPGEEEIQDGAGSYILGFAGAFLGALIGVVPWFLASTFAHFFVGWLGFLVGIAACWGYQKCRGARRTGYAMTVIVICSILALVLAEFGSWIFLLCTDPDWQADAAYYGIPVAQMAFASLLMPENLPHILPDLGMGLLIGIFGIISSRQKVLVYTDPSRAPVEARPGSAAETAAAANAAAGLPVPYAFTVRDVKWVRVLLLKGLGILCMVFFGGMLILMTFDMAAGTGDLDWRTYIFCTAEFCGLIFLGVFLFCHARRKLAVEGETLSYLPTFGRPRTFRVEDIAGMKLSANGRKLYGRDGKVLARFEDNQENSALLLQYLREKEIGLMA